MMSLENLNGGVNNNFYTCHLRISPETTGGVPSTWSGTMGIKGVKVTYTL
ncbi:hypothetical protein [Emticicia agri]|nr:hypothetical protein [Emticicia agri]